MKKLIKTMLRALDKLPGVNKKLAVFSARYLAIHENLDYNHNSNGERWLLRMLARQNRLAVCFDVGANRGDWTAVALAENPKAKVHCFEVSPPTFRKLSHRFSNDPQIVINPCGLSNQAGEIVVKHCLDSDGLSSMIEVVCSQNIETIAATVIRGVDYCVEHGITKIDFLKIDVEGAENLVLEGFSEFLTPQAVPVIQFEYGMVNIASKFLLRDFYHFFETRGYKVGKLFPRKVRFREYRFQDEDFRGPNYIAAVPDVVRLLNADNKQIAGNSRCPASCD
jgi:FkbM family methyltransferase